MRPILKKVQEKRENTKERFIREFIELIAKLPHGKHKKKEIYTNLEVSQTAFTKYILDDRIKTLIENHTIEITNRYIII